MATERTDMDSKWKKLRPFAPGGGYELEAAAERVPDGVRLRFRLRAARAEGFSAVALPAGEGTGSGERRDGLWKSTCFEAFFGIADSPEYFEFNAASSGDWAWYAFDAYRAGMRAPALEAAAEPRRVSERRAPDAYEAEWFVPHAAFAGHSVDSIGLAGVLEGAGEVSYWAVTHAGSEADFHRRESFARFP